MTSEMELVVDAGGDVRCIYDEALDLREIGTLQITRASHVEPDAEGYWWADMGPVGGPMLGPYGSRSEALGAERAWLSSLVPAGARGRAFGQYHGVTGVAVFVGGVGFGWLWQRLGSASAFLVAGGLAAVALAVLTRLAPRGPLPAAPA